MTRLDKIAVTLFVAGAAIVALAIPAAAGLGVLDYHEYLAPVCGTLIVTGTIVAGLGADIMLVSMWRGDHA